MLRRKASRADLVSSDRRNAAKTGGKAGAPNLHAETSDAERSGYRRRLPTSLVKREFNEACTRIPDEPIIYCLGRARGITIATYGVRNM